MSRSVGWLLTAALVVPGAGCLSWTRQSDEPSASITHRSDEAPAASELSATKKAEIALSVAAQLDKTGDSARALASYEQARYLDPSCGDRIAHRLAVLYDKADQTSKAAPEFERALKLAPKNANLLNDFGYHWYCVGNWS